MKIIGITGAVGAGKSTVLSILKRISNCCVIVTDEVAATLREPGGSLYSEMIKIVGSDCVGEDGSFIREKVAKKIFTDKELLRNVDALIHPAVKSEVKKIIHDERLKNRVDYIFVESALLLDDRYDEICDEMWYIFVREDVRRTRLKASRGYSDEKIDAILKNQRKDSEYRSACKWVIDNSDDEELTESQIKLLISK